MNSITRFIFVLFLVAQPAGCASYGQYRDLDWVERGTYSGLYTYDFEVSSFEPDGKEEEWWVTFDSAEYDSKFKPHISLGDYRYHLVVKGKISSRGLHGHLGKYTREIYVEEIIEVEAQSRSSFTKQLKKEIDGLINRD